MKNIYLFSGLGADERVFVHLDFTGFNITFIRWVRPSKNETIEQYAQRLTEQITTSKPILIGLSFGGMMAIEVAKIIDTERIIVISSAKTQAEIPFYYRLAGFFRLHKLVPTALLKRPGSLNNWLFGAYNAEDKAILASILRDTDNVFLKWAIDIIVRWDNKTVPKNVTHLHGTADRILPIRFVKCAEKVQGGGHLMLLNRAAELTQKMRQIL